MLEPSIVIVDRTPLMKILLKRWLTLSLYGNGPSPNSEVFRGPMKIEIARIGKGIMRIICDHRVLYNYLPKVIGTEFDTIPNYVQARASGTELSPPLTLTTARRHFDTDRS